MQRDKLEALIRILQDKKAANITEAEAFYREQKSPSFLQARRMAMASAWASVL